MSKRRSILYTHTRRMSAVGLGLALLLSAAGVRAEFVEGANSRSLIWDGIERAYLVHAPPGLDAASETPLVVAMHGFVSSPQGHQGISGMSIVSDENGFIVVYPAGVPVEGVNSWNAGGGCCQAPVRRQNDIGFVRAVVAAVRSETAVDRERIYATGLSNGGAMTHFLACDARDLFAAAAPVAFGLGIEQCAPGNPMPIMTFMGLNDVLVSYEGSPLGLGALATFAQWREINECGEEPPEIVDVSGGSDCMIDTSCGSGVHTALCSVDSRSFEGTAFEGHIIYSNPDIDVARTAWDFMSGFNLSLTAVPEPGAGLLHGAAVAAIVWIGRRQRL